MARRSRSTRWAGQAILLIVLGAFGVGALSAPAAADSPYDYGYTGGSDPIRFPDSIDHGDCRQHLDSSHHSRAAWALSTLTGATVQTSYSSGTCGTKTDVVWIDMNWCDLGCGPDYAVLGETVCVAHAYWGICDQDWVMFDPTTHFLYASNAHPGNNTAIANSYNVSVMFTMAHELGHSAGLHHYQGWSTAWRLMSSGWLCSCDPNMWTFLTYSSTHVGYIDDYLT